jgi:DNA-binding transcriptional MerR regulator
VNNTQITSGEVARALGISTSLIRKLELEGVTPPARRLARFRIYSPSEVETLRQILEQRRARQARTRQEPRAA